MKKIAHPTSKDGTALHSSAGVRIAVSQAHSLVEFCLDKQKNNSRLGLDERPGQLFIF